MQQGQQGQQAGAPGRQLLLAGVLDVEAAVGRSAEALRCVPCAALCCPAMPACSPAWLTTRPPSTLSTCPPSRLAICVTNLRALRALTRLLD